MAPNANKDPIGTLIDKLRAFLGFGDHPKNNNTLPPKRRFNIWYLMMAVLFFSYAAAVLVFFKSGDDSRTVNLNNPLPTGPWTN